MRPLCPSGPLGTLVGVVGLIGLMGLVGPGVGGCTFDSSGLSPGSGLPDGALPTDDGVVPDPPRPDLTDVRPDTPIDRADLPLDQGDACRPLTECPDGVCGTIDDGCGGEVACDRCASGQSCVK